MNTSADRYVVLLCTVLVRLAVCSPALVLDLSPHWGQECPGEADWSQYVVMHHLQNQGPQSDGPGSLLKFGGGSSGRSLFIDGQLDTGDFALSSSSFSQRLIFCSEVSLKS